MPSAQKAMTELSILQTTAEPATAASAAAGAPGEHAGVLVAPQDLQRAVHAGGCRVRLDDARDEAATPAGERQPSNRHLHIKGTSDRRIFSQARTRYFTQGGHWG